VTYTPRHSTDTGLAVEILDASPFVRMAADAGCWLRNYGTHWEEWGTKSDAKERAASLAYAFGNNLAPIPGKPKLEDVPQYQYLSDEALTGALEKLEDFRKFMAAVHKKFGSASGKSSISSDMIRVSHAEPARHEYVSKLDAEAHILWCGGYPVNLKRSTERLVMAVPGTYNPIHKRSAAFLPDLEAETPAWDAFLETIWPDDAPLRDWAVREIASVALWGDTSKSHPVMDGKPNGGKSTFANALVKLLGTYAIQVEPGKLIGSSATGSDTEERKYRMIGARLVWLDEPPARNSQSISQFNDLASGTGHISASRKYSNEVTAPKRYNFLICQNPRNALNMGAQGVAERLVLIPCGGDPAEVKKSRAALLAAFESEAPGILAKLITECAKHRNGDILPMPESANMYRQSVRDRGDEFKAWLLENYTIQSPETPLKDRGITIGKLREAFNAYAKDAPGRPQISRDDIHDRLKELDVHNAGDKQGPGGKRNLLALKFTANAPGAWTGV
jgi:uncharacterized protein DUF5906